MFELEGKYNKCKVFTDNCENSTIGQLTTLLNQESVSNSKIRIMSDCHSGKGCVIGTTMTLSDKVIPNLVGVDIGCFTGDTLVWLSRGSYVPIKDLVNSKKDFRVDSFDIYKKSFVVSNAIARKTRENAELVRVNYGRHSVRCTPDHKFLVSTNTDVYYDSDATELIWVDARDLKTGMRLVAEDNLVIVNSVETLTEREDVYCLTVDDTHNFTIEGGIIVHNCGMLTIKLKEKRIDLPKLDSVIRKNVPSGSYKGTIIRDSRHSKTSDLRIEDLALIGKRHAKVKLDKAFLSCGTLGGGNHFIEVDKDEEDNLYLVIHTGSRLLGMEICNYYQEEAYNRYIIQDYDREYARLLSETDPKDRSKVLMDFSKKKKSMLRTDVPFELAYCEGDLMKDYLHDMQITQEFASINRQIIANVILKNMKLHSDDEFETIHNYIDMDNMILRKGAVSAQKGEKLIIPMNMRDGSLICIGKGNEDWNFSAPHGAGRLMKRSVAKETISMSEYRESMRGIYTTSVNTGTIDESPMAYKPMNEIVKNIKDTVDIVNIIKPIYNFKAGKED